MYLMHRNDKLALIDDNYNVLDVYIKHLMPSRVSKGSNLQGWIDTRLIDEHRPSSRRLKKILRLQTIEDGRDFSIIDNNLITITDNWWICKENTSLNYYNLKQYNEGIAEVLIQGIRSRDLSINLTKDYCELGTTGSYEKCWKFLNNKWTLFKENSLSEAFSEIYSSIFLKSLEFNVIDYSLVELTSDIGIRKSYTICKDFTNNATLDFEPICNLIGEDEDIEYIVGYLENISKQLVFQYLDICLSDALVYNTDRYNQNLGILRNSNTGEIVSLAPNYDLNQSLIAYSKPDVNGLVKMFICSVKGLKDEYHKYLKRRLQYIQLNLDNSLIKTNSIIKSINQFNEINLEIVQGYIEEVIIYLKSNI